MVTITQDGVLFQSSDQSLFGPDSGISASIPFTAPAIDPAPFSSSFFIGDVELTPALRIAGRTIIPAVVIPVNSGFSVFSDFSATFGLEPGVSLDLGLIDSLLTFDISTDFASDFRALPGAETTFVEGGSADATGGEFTTSPLSATAFVDQIFDLFFQFDLSATLFGNELIPDSFSGILIDESIRTSIVRAEISAFNAPGFSFFEFPEGSGNTLLNFSTLQQVIELQAIPQPVQFQVTAGGAPILNAFPSGQLFSFDLADITIAWSVR